MKSDWEKVTLGDLMTFKNGLNYTQDSNGKEYNFLGVGCFKSKNSIKNASELETVYISNPVDKDYLLKKDDLVFVRSNGSKELVGRCVLIENDISNATYSGFCIKGVLKSEKTTSKYILKNIEAGFLKEKLKHENRGTNISNLNQEILNSLEIKLPSLNEQDKIIETLNVWDSAIEKTEKLISEKDKLFNGVSQKIFRKPGSKHKISEYLSVRNEKCIPNDTVPLYSLTIENGVTPKSDRYDREALVKDTDEKEYKVVYPGDIVFNPANLRWGAIARSNEINKVVVSPIYEVLSLDVSKIDSDYLTFLLTSKDKIQYYATKTEGTLVERMAVKVDVFLNFEIEIEEDYEKQKASAEVLTVLKKEISLLKKQLEQYKLQKKGLMQKLLTGQWRVK